VADVLTNPTHTVRPTKKVSNPTVQLGYKEQLIALIEPFPGLENNTTSMYRIVALHVITTWDPGNCSTTEWMLVA
jgi:hypothetical protein